MTLKISSTEDPNRLDIYEEDSKIGEIVCELPDPDDPTDSDPPYWSAEIWSLMGTGKVWGADSKSLDEIKEYAHELYAEFVAERRELNRGRRPSTISVPMGGQRRR